MGNIIVAVVLLALTAYVLWWKPLYWQIKQGGGETSPVAEDFVQQNHFTPDDDIFEHVIGDDCVCGPREVLLNTFVHHQLNDPMFFTDSAAYVLEHGVPEDIEADDIEREELHYL